jgi:hypothetical protein
MFFQEPQTGSDDFALVREPSFFNQVRDDSRLMLRDCVHAMTSVGN